MANKQPLPLDELLIPSLLPRVYDFLFQHIPSNECLLLPSPEDWKKRFFKSDEFDSACTSQFSPIFAAIHEANLSAEDILSRTHPSTPQAWLALIILLDQLPRNIYRGQSSRIVPFRYRQAQRIWFYLPFIHAEDLRMQELAGEKYQEMGEDLARLLDRDATALSDDEQECRRVLAENRARLEEQLALHFRVQREHYDPVARFGRFPHRNAVLGRGMSEEERRFVEGGYTFGQ
ncbi:hypothetical protein CDV55_105572 [Aspergillus turcosus]|nr:hypothetical protein CDV55_105572 [Aspergillus turcosus]